ncbi:MAG: TrbC/VirB2 family protein [Alphaproteobacteria bacterium]|nr:TrbC/VirB2 family protein [Alphaproteobacteria bacterium]
MKFLKNNILSLTLMTVLFSVVMMGDASASVFGTAGGKLVNLFKNAKMIIFIIGGFGLIALAFQAIFGKVKWAWFAALAFGLAVVAAASSIITYAANSDAVFSRSEDQSLGDTLGTGSGQTGSNF